MALTTSSTFTQITNEVNNLSTNAFTQEYKQDLADAITNMGVPASPSDTFTQLISKFGQIETTAGKQTIKVFVQTSEPQAIQSGDVWVQTNVQPNRILLGSGYDTGLVGDVWVGTNTHVFEFNIAGAMSLINESGTALIAPLNRTGQSDIDGISDKYKLWESKAYSLWGLLGGVRIHNGSQWNFNKAFVWSGTAWIPFSYAYLYYNGVEDGINFIAGEKTGYFYLNPQFSKQQNYLHFNFRGTGEGTGEYYATTENKINLSGVNKIKIDWENTGDDNTSNNSYFVVGNTQKAWYNNYVARASKSKNFMRTVDEIDVSTLTGEYYLRLHGRDSSSMNGYYVTIRIYAIYLE